MDLASRIKEKWPYAIECGGTVIALTAISLGIGYFDLGFGVISGFTLALTNYFILDRIIATMFRDFSPTNSFSMVAGVIQYHLRFWLLGIAIYFLFQSFGSVFGLSVVFGMSIPKWFQVYKEIQAAILIS